jgi:hypothetical protein
VVEFDRIDHVKWQTWLGGFGSAVVTDTMETAANEEPKEAEERTEDGSAPAARTSARGKRTRELQALAVDVDYASTATTTTASATTALPADPNGDAPPQRGGASKRPRYPSVQVALAAPDDRKRDRWKGTSVGLLL